MPEESRLDRAVPEESMLEPPSSQSPRRRWRIAMRRSTRLPRHRPSQWLPGQSNPERMPRSHSGPRESSNCLGGRNLRGSLILLSYFLHFPTSCLPGFLASWLPSFHASPDQTKPVQKNPCFSPCHASRLKGRRLLLSSSSPENLFLGGFGFRNGPQACFSCLANA